MKKRKERAKRKVEREVVLSALALICAVGGADANAQAAVSSDSALTTLNVEADAIAKRKKLLEQVDQLLGKVSDAYKAADISTASVHIDEINQLLSELEGPYGEMKRKSINKMLNDKKIALAKRLYSDTKKAIDDKKYDIALSNLAKAKAVLSYVDEFGIAQKLDDGLYDSITDCEKLVNSRAKNVAIKEATKITNKDVDPNFETRSKDIKILLEQAKTLRKEKKYTEARDVLESILLKDVYNVAAISLLDEVYKDMIEVGRERRYNEILQGIHESTWNWNESIVEKRDTSKINAPKVLKSDNAIVAQKLRTIIIDSIEFDGADINTAVRYLSERSKELDKEGNGVSIAASDALRKSATDQTITMSFDNIPLGVALKYLGQKLGTTFTITDMGVILGPVAQEMETRAIKVRPQLIASISGGSDDEEEDDGGDDFAIDDEVAADKGDKGDKGSNDSEALKQYFVERGIKFPENARLRYNSNSNKLFVTNTIDNITKLEELIRQLDIEVPLVLIEAKMLEITEDDLDDLGFNWSVTNTDTGWNGNYNYYRDTGKLVKSDTTDDALKGVYNVVNNLKLFPGSSDSDGPMVTVIAIQQQKRGELLSAPKVVATSGETASVMMVAEHYFPESWDAPTVEINRDRTTIQVPTPSFGDTTPVGIQLEVTPTVTSNYTISMEIHPTITKVAEMKEYGYKIVTDGQGDDVGGYYFDSTEVREPVTKYVTMPNIATRELTANIKVYDGETIVLGGLLTEESRYVDEKNPFFGELPLVGRLFNRKSEEKVKKNILIFVTARLIGGDGSPIRKNTDRGLPDFNR